MAKFDMQRSYAREKFGTAVDIMATSAQSIQERLNSAFMSFVAVSAKDFVNGEERALFEEIMTALTRQPAVGDEGQVRTTLNVMDDDEASHVASLIVSLESRLRNPDED